MDVDYTPSGNKMISGSWDSTVRIWPAFTSTTSAYDSHFKPTVSWSVDMYHTARMDRVSHVKTTMDGKYFLSASIDHNIRIWKVEKSKPLRVMDKKEKQQYQYSQRLAEKYSQFNEVKTIKGRVHQPRHVHVKQRVLKAMRNKRTRKETNKRDNRVLYKIKKQKVVHIEKNLE